MIDIARLEGKLEAFAAAMKQCSGQNTERTSSQIHTAIDILHLETLRSLAEKKKITLKYDDSVPPIWETLAAIGETAPPGTFPDMVVTEYEQKLVLLGKTLLANLISQQQFEEPYIEWLDFMNFATEYGLAVEHQTRDDDLCWNRVY